MKFRMTCPKCASTTFSIERDNRSYAPRGQTFEMIFSCRCGKQLFGEQIVKEYDRQKKEWELQRDESDTGARPQERVEEARPAVRIPSPRLEPEPSAAVEEDHAHDESEVDDIEDDEDFDDTSGDGDICGWHPCSNAPRPNSKYCSRDCSNKNARWRYKQRKAAEKEAA